MKSDHLAKEGERLRADPIFNMALDAIRAEALEGLALIAADDITAVLRLQARVSAVDEIRNVLDRYILQGQEPEETGSFA